MAKDSIPKKEKQNQEGKQIFFSRRDWGAMLEEAISAAPTGMLICELIRRKQHEIDGLSDMLAQLDGGAMYEHN